jgi:hypothetical protein
MPGSRPRREQPNPYSAAILAKQVLAAKRRADDPYAQLSWRERDCETTTVRRQARTRSDRAAALAAPEQAATERPPSYMGGDGIFYTRTVKAYDHKAFSPDERHTHPARTRRSRRRQSQDHFANQANAIVSTSRGGVGAGCHQCQATGLISPGRIGYARGGAGLVCWLPCSGPPLLRSLSPGQGHRRWATKRLAPATGQAACERCFHAQHRRPPTPPTPSSARNNVGRSEAGKVSPPDRPEPRATTRRSSACSPPVQSPARLALSWATLRPACSTTIDRQRLNRRRRRRRGVREAGSRPRS